MSAGWTGSDVPHDEPPHRLHASVDGAVDQEEWSLALQENDWSDWLQDFENDNLPSPPPQHHPPNNTSDVPSIRNDSRASPQLPPSTSFPPPALHEHSNNSHRHRQASATQDLLASNASRDPRTAPRDNVASTLAGQSLYSITGGDQVIAGPSHHRVPQSTSDHTRTIGRTENSRQSDEWLNDPTVTNPAVISSTHEGNCSDITLHPRRQADTDDLHFAPHSDRLLSGGETDMAPKRRRSSTNAIDLTGETSSPSGHGQQRQEDQPRNVRSAIGAASDASGTIRPQKRQKRIHGASGSVDDIAPDDALEDHHGPEDSKDVELLDLTADETAVAQTIAAQQQSAHDSSSAGPTSLGKKTCIICMEAFTDATTTMCGHMYCFECLNQALMAGERNSERGVGTCPVCRKTINRRRVKNALLPISFMKKSAFYSKGRGSELDEKKRAGA